MAARKPTAVLQLSGAFKHNPARAQERENEPEPKAGIGPAPSRLSILEAEAWDYLVGISPPGVLGDSDRAHLELTARLMAYSWETPFSSIDTAKLNRLAAMLGQMGFNPVDRSKVKVGGKPNHARTGNRFGSLDQ